LQQQVKGEIEAPPDGLDGVVRKEVEQNVHAFSLDA
jgi:hypothetical protein